MKKISLFHLLVLLSTSILAQQKTYDITSFGAKGDSLTNNAPFIQKAIDEASASGGGRVLIPAGRFMTSVIQLKSGVELYVSANAQLLGSTKRSDYGKEKASALIVADNQHHISITGTGTIDGRGREVVADVDRMLKAGTLQDPQWQTVNPWGQKRSAEFNRPHLLTFNKCDHVAIKGILLKDAACWVETYHECTNLTIDSIRVQSTAYYNNDGIDVDNCKNVKITRCTVNADDDGICLKSNNDAAICENVEISDCVIRSSASALKFGTASHGGFKNVMVKNLKIYDTYRSAIALESVDGGTLENINIENVKATNTGNGIFIRLGHRKKEAPIGKVRNIRIANVQVEVPAGKPDKGYEMEGPVMNYPHNVFPASVTGLPDNPVENILLENISISYEGGGSKQVAHFGLDSLSKVPENAGDYPEFSMFGELPCWGLYMRHARGIILKNVKLQYKKEDFRPAMVVEDVQQLVVEGLQVPSGQSAPVIVLKNVPTPALSAMKLPYDNSKAVMEVK
ncbi:glycoside hydrolase family 28 [Niastella yeongjuensis]|uniref:Glycoside hydrolase family 28 n=1 Tax=Niastella yeongjuensis TaxID=354355 RepID=A0A1V9F4P9_9BACT|nr:glycosyl hydrolase family 28 protein [Niastella yeongjuensis]OQP53369.1 glycoside hydrolase family 28 [Niastella yeongjuensis]SEP13910.1 Glycosyl hydrolases family 28 [Niastella yeongjuensis]